MGDALVKYDVRFSQQNKEHMDMMAVHSMGHLKAELIRNHAEFVIGFGPMGCQTGFYLKVMNHESYAEILNVLEKTMLDVLNDEEVSASNEQQCGWAASQTLEGDKEGAKVFLAKRDAYSTVCAENA